MTTPPTQYISALSLASPPSPSSYRAPPSQPSGKPSYRSLLKSHRRLESTIAALQSQLNEEKRSAAWWKNRVCELDTRCRSIDVDLARVTREKHTLDRTVAKLQMRERIVPRMIEAAVQTDGEGADAVESQEGESWKDLAVKSASAAAVGPLAGEDPLKGMLRGRGKRLGKARTVGALEERDSGRAPLVENPPYPNPEAASKPRREKKEALRVRLWAVRERVDGLRKENGVLEGLLREGSEVGSNRTAERYGDRFGYD